MCSTVTSWVRCLCHGFSYEINHALEIRKASHEVNPAFEIRKAHEIGQSQGRDEKGQAHEGKEGNESHEIKTKERVQFKA